jgi:hypothetical protein
VNALVDERYRVVRTSTKEKWIVILFVEMNNGDGSFLDHHCLDGGPPEVDPDQLPHRGAVPDTGACPAKVQKWKNWLLSGS